MGGRAALFGALGLVGIVFGLSSFVMLLLGMPTQWGWSLGNLAVGIGLLIGAGVANLESLRERVSSGGARRAGKYGSSALVGTVLGIAIVGMLGFLSTRYHVRWDWSEQGIHSLSEQSKKVVQGLDEDVEVVALFSVVEQDFVRDLLDKYAYESERFDLSYADPNERPDLLDRYALSPQQLGNGV